MHLSLVRLPVVCLLAIGLYALIATQASLGQGGDSRARRVSSPDGRITFLLSGAQPLVGATGTSAGKNPVEASMYYAVEFRGKRVIEHSRLGLELVGAGGQVELGPGMIETAAATGRADETYTIPVGKTREVRNHYNSLRADFADGAGHKITVEVRVFDDGVAFRYVVPDQSPSKNGETGKVVIKRELTEFTFAKDATTYPLLLEGFQTAYEDEYTMRQLSGLHKDWLIGLPFLAEEPGLAWVAITEADIDHYAGMYLKKAAGPFAVRSELSPHVDDPNIAVDTPAPASSPWRVLMIGDEPGRLVESNIVLNLNPQSKIADTSWIRPGKSAWDWWSGEAAPGASFKTGMNTNTMKHYIDFAADSGFPYMLIDAGWAAVPGSQPNDYAQLADITQVNPDVDLQGLIRYARERNVKIWLWAHWTSVDKYMDRAFPLYEKWGIAGVKIDFMNRDDQWMVDFYHRVVENAAAHHLMIDFHGAYKPDGLRRTWPNLITRESVMGKEYLKWSARTGPVHNTTLPFTRMLAGPMDYTPGAFGNANRETFVARNLMPMGLGTRAHELALFVVLESPFEMVSDYPEHYQGQKEFEFIKRVPTTWDELHVLGGVPMEWISLARRSGKDWYLGSLSSWDDHSVNVPLSFLGPGNFVAEIYADAPDAAQEPTHTTFSRQAVTKDSVLQISMVPGGGNAVWIHPAQ
jgi:alpha-glucosidase